MNKYLRKVFNNNWFFISLLCFVVVLPFSQALVSIFGGVLLFTALVEDSWVNKFNRIKKHKIILFIPAIFFIYVISSIITYKSGKSLYDLQKSLFFLVIPLAFLIGKNISNFQKRFLFYAFAVAIFISTLVALIYWRLDTENVMFEVHKISLISHIRFSFQLILIFWFLILFIAQNKKYFTWPVKISLMFLSAYFLAFLIFQQSLTGLIAFGGSLFFNTIYFLFQHRYKYRMAYLLIAASIIIVPIFYVVSIVNSFFNIEKVDKLSIEKTTGRGNPYSNNFDDPMVENGRYVKLYICTDEMREEWNKISTIKYDSIMSNGYPLESTLIRYLTSKGLRKDADGVLALNSQDITNVENGIANVIFQTKRYTLYPRIYQTVWEYYVYSKTGNANHQSFSQRIEFSKAAITIIKENFWFGVGTGNWKDEFRNTFIKNNSKLSEDLYASSHNQYLNYWVKFGITGFLLIMFFIIYPIIKTRRYRDSLFLIFLVFLFIANLSDSNFESHMGSSFFLFFYCLFLVSGDINYLKLNNNKI